IVRKKPPMRPVVERIHDWREVYLPYPAAALRDQASRCMDCGIPFCHQGCPLGNLIPDWNDFVYRDRRQAALERLHATNHFPEFKLEKRILDRRLLLMREEGVVFRTGSHIGVNVPIDELRREFDAIVLTGGSTVPRDLPVPGRELEGIHFAMEYLTAQNRRCEEDGIVGGSPITAKDKHVIIIGGGDTGADCLGTAHRQGAKSVHQLELLPRPPDSRAPNNP